MVTRGVLRRTTIDQLLLPGFDATGPRVLGGRRSPAGPSRDCPSLPLDDGPPSRTQLGRSPEGPSRLLCTLMRPARTLVPRSQKKDVGWLCLRSEPARVVPDTPSGGYNYPSSPRRAPRTGRHPPRGAANPGSQRRTVRQPLGHGAKILGRRVSGNTPSVWCLSIRTDRGREQRNDHTVRFVDATRETGRGAASVSGRHAANT